jgi:hypothetical protein
MLRTGGGMDFTDGGSPRPLSFDTPTAAPDAYAGAYDDGRKDKNAGDGGGAMWAVIVGFVILMSCGVGYLVYMSGAPRRDHDHAPFLSFLVRRDAMLTAHRR